MMSRLGVIAVVRGGGGGAGGSVPCGHPPITSDHRVLINFSTASDCNQQNHRGNEIFFFHGVEKHGVKMHISLVFLINILCLGSMLTVSLNELCGKRATQRTKGNFPPVFADVLFFILIQ